MSATDVSALLWRTWMKDLNLSQGYVPCSFLKTGNIYVHLHIQQEVSRIWLCVLGSAMCCCKGGEQTVDHILCDCKLLEQERDSLKGAVLRAENWSVSKNKLINKFYNNFKIIYEQCTLRQIIDNIVCIPSSRAGCRV
jgi:hypothetical protein